jgi:hypothetical protein
LQHPTRTRFGRDACYYSVMTKLLDHAMDVARGLSPETQDDLARALLELAGAQQPALELTADEEAALAEALAQVDRGEFASEEQVNALWTKHDH